MMRTPQHSRRIKISTVSWIVDSLASYRAAVNISLKYSARIILNVALELIINVQKKRPYDNRRLIRPLLYCYN